MRERNIICTKDCICNGGKQATCYVCRRAFALNLMGRTKTIVVTNCPYHELDFTQERFIYEMQAHYYNQVNALGKPLIDYPQWLADGMAVCGSIRAQMQKARQGG